MKQRRAFTLVELILAVFIFSYMSASLATIYATTNRHMFQNYRKNVIKTGVLVSMRAIQNNLSLATRIDAPLDNNWGNVLAFATNVDQLSGCYPVNQDSVNGNSALNIPANPPAWHYFCVANDPMIPGTRSLYYHTANLPPGTPCGSPGASVWNGVYPVPSCGASLGGQRVTLLMQHVSPSPAMSGFLFSRRSADTGTNALGAVRVNLRSFWDSAGRGFGSAARNVDFSLDTVITVNRAGP